MASQYSSNQLSFNKYSGQNTGKALQKAVVLLETGLKFLIGFIGSMVKMITGKY